MMAVAHPIEAKPLVEMNTTPLIDVLLVLLIMFIITVPIQTHAVKFDIPAGTPPHVEVNPVKNVLVVTRDGGTLWNGQPISEPALRSTLAATAQMPSQPELHLRPESEAPYERVDEVLALTKGAGVTKLGFVGNEAYLRAF